MSIQPLAALLAVLALAACASPDPKLYTLAPTAPSAVPPSRPDLVLQLHRADIPGYADRPEIVRSSADYRVHLADNERWSAPLGDLVQSALTADLVRRLPGAMVFSDTGSLSAPATQVLEMNISDLASDGAGNAVLDAQFVLRGVNHGTGPDPVPLSRSVHLSAPIAGPSTTAYAAALSDVIGKLADDVAAASASLPPVAAPAS